MTIFAALESMLDIVTVEPAILKVGADNFVAGFVTIYSTGLLLSLSIYPSALHRTVTVYVPSWDITVDRSIVLTLV